MNSKCEINILLWENVTRLSLVTTCGVHAAVLDYPIY